MQRSKGSAFFDKGKWRCKVTVAGKRPSFGLPTCTTEAQADRRALLLTKIGKRLVDAGMVDRAPKILGDIAGLPEGEIAGALTDLDVVLRSAPKPRAGDGMTVRQLGEAWTSGKLHREYPDHVRAKATSADDAYRLAKYVYPVLESTPVAEVTLEDCERVLRGMPVGLSPATRRQVGQTIARMLNMAVYPLRLRESSPIPKGFLPRSRSAIAFSFLYPEEESALAACQVAPKDHKHVPLKRRVLYAFLAREGMRWGEATHLTWADLDMERGLVRLDENKTADPRMWALGSDVAEGLRRWRKLVPKAKPGDLVFGVNSDSCDHQAKAFREHLRSAGVTRPELFEESEHRRPIRVHDLRASFITLALAGGKTETWVCDRTGHKSSQMIARYRRAARTAGELNLGWFAPMFEAIPELSAVAGNGTSDPGEVSGEVSAEGKKEGVPSDGNPCKTSCGSAGTRTPNLRIKSPLLYQLSY